jgi:hypothetical protein
MVDTIFDRKDLIASNLRFKASVDQSYLLVYYPYFSGSTVQSMKFLCIDHSLATVYNKSIPIDRDERELEESKALVDNQGNSFFIMKQESKGEGNIYSVFHVGAEGSASNYNLITEKALFSEPSFDIDSKNGNMVMTALYSESNDKEASHGFLYASFDPANGTPVRTKYTPFSHDFITELTGRENKDVPKLFTFNIRKTLLRNDGGCLILAESFIKDTREQPVNIGMQPGFNSFRSATLFQFNDIIAFSIKPSGEMEWHAVMRKKQASEDDNGAYSSFLTVNEKDRLHLLFLDDISTTGYLREHILSSTGKADKANLVNQDDKDVMLLVKMGRQVTPNEVVIPSYKSGALRIVRIIY